MAAPIEKLELDKTIEAAVTLLQTSATMISACRGRLSAGHLNTSFVPSAPVQVTCTEICPEASVKNNGTISNCFCPFINIGRATRVVMLSGDAWCMSRRNLLQD
jgi:hypothetical protein